MKIGTPRITIEGSRAFYKVPVTVDTIDSELWYSVDAKWQNFLSQRADAALLGLLMPAMVRGEDLEITGPVCHELLHNIANPLQSLLCGIFGHAKRIQISARQPIDVSIHANGVATGLSGSVDSFCTIADYYCRHPPENLQLTHLIYNDAVFRSQNEESVFDTRLQILSQAAERLGLPLIAVRSNLQDFHQLRGLNYARTHTLRNTSVALALQNGLGRFLYSSAYAYHELHGGPATDPAWSDPMLLALLSTDALRTRSVGSEYLRIEKMSRIVEVTETRQSLHVCVDSDSPGNCSQCWKCLRTQFNLELLGALPDYQDCFDHKKYLQHKTRFLAKVLSSRDPLISA